MGIRASILATKPGTHLTGPTIESLDLDKTWHGLYYLLSGSAEPGDGIASFLLSGQEVEDVGDAEVYLHSPEEVLQFSQLLQATPASVLQERYAPAQMKALEVYPDLTWDQDDLKYLLEYYDELCPFVQRHAEAGNELLVVIC